MSSPRDKIEAKLGLSGPPLQRVRESPPSIPAHELLRRIGQGAYGEVWLARNALGTWRAVKIVFRDNFRDDRPYEREFAGIRRFEPLSRSNEGFVDVLQVGRDDAEGYFYYVMELADDASNNTLRRDDLRESQASPASGDSGILGTRPPDDYAPRTLARDLAQRGRLPLEDCLELGLTLTLALAHLHRHGLIHRDIKPSNIIYVGGVPKLADIGLVTEAQGANTFVGTEGFVPPEGPTSPQADLYALGKVLYEAAMGKDRNEFPEPFTQIGTDQQSLALMELNAVLLRACAPDPQKRYASAEEMHADLALLQSGGSVKRRHQFDRQFQIAKQVGAVGIAAALLIGGAWLWQKQQTRKMTLLATEKSALATEKTKLADDLTKLGEENRTRIVRLDIANGVRLLDEGDPGGALLWFADALPRLTNNPAEESVHRIRIQQTMNRIPRLVHVLPHTNSVLASAFSADGRHVLTGTDWGYLRVWDARTGSPLWSPLALGVWSIEQTRFTSDGRLVFASSSPRSGFLKERYPTNIATLIEATTGRQLVSLSGTNWVRADLSPDDRWLVIADTDNVIHVHDSSNGRPVAECTGHTNRISQFLFSDSGELLASASTDHTVRFWHLPSGQPLGSPIRFEPGPITLSGDGKLLAIPAGSTHGSSNSTVQIWDVRTGAVVGTLIEVPGAIRDLRFLPKGERDLFVLSDRQGALFDRETHQQSRRSILTPPESPIYWVSPDGRFVAFAGAKGFEGMWSFETGELSTPPCLRNKPLKHLNVAPDGLHLLAAQADGTALLLDAHLLWEDLSYRFDGLVEKREPNVFLAWHHFSPNRRFFLLNPQDRTVRLVDFERMTSQNITPPEFRSLKALQCTFDTSGRHRATWYTGAGTNLVELWTEDGRTTNRFILAHPDTLCAKLLFTADGRRLITPGTDGWIRFWSTADGTLERSVRIANIGQPMLFPDGHTAFAISASTGHFALFNLETGSLRPCPQVPTIAVTALIFDPKGDRFASTAEEENWSRVWNARTCEPLTPRLDHEGEVRWVDWSSDGERLLTAGLTPEVRVWDSTTGEPLLAPLRLGSKPLETAQWSLDGRFIVARSDENTARVWDAVTGEPVTPVLQHSGYVQFASLVANNRLVTISLPNLMRAWDLRECPLPAEVLVDYVKLVSGGRLNAAGAMIELAPNELAELCRSLQTRAPELFQ